MEETEKYFFDHEKLRVYQRAIEFVKWTDSLLKKIEIRSSTKDQLERASESIVLNISEGNGKFLPKDRCRYFDISRGSAMECAGCLDVLFARNLIDYKDREEGKVILKDVINMLMGLIKSNSDRVYETQGNYE
ncbi:MAG: four helix bundle protein [Ignavibacteriales bacterium]|nr:four helix bundle protein [Ignavibacteriales bacterium]